MILVWMIIILIVAGLLAWISGKLSAKLPAWISLSALFLNLLISISILLLNQPAGGTDNANWLANFSVPWIPQLGISFHLAADSLSLMLLILIDVMAILAIISTWKQEHTNQGFFYFNLLLVITGISGVFLASDLFLFYFFWEVMLIPMYFLISIWGGKKKQSASIKFFIFTQAGGLIMLLSILGIYFIHGRTSGLYTFDYEQMLNLDVAPQTGIWLMLGLLFGFGVKLPLVPFHTWLPGATREAPTAAGIILTGFLWTTAAYGIIRYAIPIFPELSRMIAPYAMVLAVLVILYGAKLAYAQTDLKKLIAYSSIGHIGFLILGIYSFNQIAMQGVIMTIIAHAVSATAMLILAGSVGERLKLGDLAEMGGLWDQAPRMGGTGMVFILATLGLPGLGNFVGEFLILLGAYQANITLTILASLGLIVSAVYALRIAQNVFFGKTKANLTFPDLGFRETSVAIILVVLLLWLGLYPLPVLNRAKPFVNKILMHVNMQDTSLSTHDRNSGEKNLISAFFLEEKSALSKSVNIPMKRKEPRVE